MAQNQKYLSTWFVFAVGANAIVLCSCTKRLDTLKVESDIQQTIIRQGGSSLKTVSCPEDVALEAGKQFSCEGTLDSGETLAISVTQTDGHGVVTWDVPNAKGLLNLVKLKSLFEQTTQQEGKALAIDCGQGYRSVQPGDRFECRVGKALELNQAQKLTGKSGTRTSVQKAAVNQLETIVVTIDSQDNVNWQQVTSGATIAAVQQSPTTNSPTESAPVPQPTPTISAVDRAKLSPEVQKKLDQIGGGDLE